MENEQINPQVMDETTIIELDPIPFSDDLAFIASDPLGNSGKLPASEIADYIADKVQNTFEITCDSAASDEIKTITIEGLVLQPKMEFGITFTAGNSFGETTAATPTYPKLKINNETEYPICDSRGHFAGKGFCNPGDYIILRFTGSRFCIVNSDIRESVQDSSSGYTIKSNNKIEQWGNITIPSNPYNVINFLRTINLNTLRVSFYKEQTSANPVVFSKTANSINVGLLSYDNKIWEAGNIHYQIIYE